MSLESIHALLLNHKYLPISRIEKAFFKDLDFALRSFKKIDGVDGVSIIQTCNRVEVYCDLNRESTIDDVLKMWSRLTNDLDIERDTVRISGLEAFKHLTRLASGLESMVIGEQEILRQLKDAYYKALSANALSQLLKFMIEESIRIGKKIRSETDISRKKVSLAHVAVRSVEKILENLNDKVILIVGAGETGELVNSALMEKQYRRLTLLFANRTYDRATRLADISGGIALHLNQIDKYLHIADVVFVTTSAPHYIITRKKIEEIKGREKPLLIVDLSVPRNVDPEVSKLPNIKLLSLDELKEYIDDSTYCKIKELDRIETLIEDSVKSFLERLEIMKINELVSEIYRYAEKVRIEELDEAFSMIEDDKLDEKTRKTLDNMSKAIVKRILNPLIENLKRNYKCIDREGLRKILQVYVDDQNQGQS
ncbi:MAG: glutamyl-tRNA reductase [Aigarchaeota archaeon]|nr:glutamyl-tRNA reductase [Aigarchaeota archaeon]MCX8192524.1 glutamyl-tRNA reductase [Nitrososphaeria archaeon]MDW7985740.1 glutamyl-tRNA reductase [Nitrososphaerota archaeon]